MSEDDTPAVPDWVRPYAHLWARIPQRMHSSIHNYVQHGAIPGNFLRSIICNDLSGTFMAADDENKMLVPAYISLFFNAVPGSAWGSRDLMEAWSESGGLDARAEDAA